MASLIEDLIQILKDENEQYKQLLVLTNEKTPVIVKGDLEKLSEITAKEQVFVENLNKLERRRTESVKDIAMVLNKDEKDMTIPNLVKMLEGQEKEQTALSEIHRELKTTLTKVSAVNDVNQNLITTSLEMVEFNINMYKGMYQSPELGNYNRSAYNTDAADSFGGVFDAKN